MIREYGIGDLLFCCVWGLIKKKEKTFMETVKSVIIQTGWSSFPKHISVTLNPYHVFLSLIFSGNLFSTKTASGISMILILMSKIGGG